MATRKKWPADVKQAVLHESGYRCGNPRCGQILTLDIHHITPVSKLGPNTADNALPLCPNCHAEHHNKIIPDSSVRAWKMLLLALNEGFNRRDIGILLAHDKIGVVKPITGDKVLDLGQLIASGLVEVGHHQHATGLRSAEQLYQVDLSPRGKLFVEHWKNGDQHAALSVWQPPPPLTVAKPAAKKGKKK